MPKLMQNINSQYNKRAKLEQLTEVYLPTDKKYLKIS